MLQGVRGDRRPCSEVHLHWTPGRAMHYASYAVSLGRGREESSEKQQVACVCISGEGGVGGRGEEWARSVCDWRTRRTNVSVHRRPRGGPVRRGWLGRAARRVTENTDERRRTSSTSSCDCDCWRYITTSLDLTQSLPPSTHVPVLSPDPWRPTLRYHRSVAQSISRILFAGTKT